MANPVRDSVLVPASATMAAGLQDLPLTEVNAVRRLTVDIAHGDEAAFTELYDRYHVRLFRLGLVLGHGDESLAHDIVQSVMVTAARKLKPVDTEAHLWNWLARVTRQHVTKALRRTRRDSAVVSVPDLPELAQPSGPDSLLEESLDRALQSLEPEERRLVELFYFEKLSCQEIAERDQTTPKAVSSRLERARLKLRTRVTRNLSHET